MYEDIRNEKKGRTNLYSKNFYEGIYVFFPPSFNEQQLIFPFVSVSGSKMFICLGHLCVCVRKWHSCSAVPGDSFVSSITLIELRELRMNAQSTTNGTTTVETMREHKTNEQRWRRCSHTSDVSLRVQRVAISSLVPCPIITDTRVDLVRFRTGSTRMTRTRRRSKQVS